MTLRSSFVLGAALTPIIWCSELQAQVFIPEPGEPCGAVGCGTGKNITGSNSSERIFGSPIDDQIRANGGNDTVYGDHGNDYINGGAGNDYLRTIGGRNRIFGGSGHDTIVDYSSERSSLLGEDGNDTINGNGASSLSGGHGNDRISGGLYVVGGDGDDTISGGRRRASGGRGNDTIRSPGFVDGGSGRDLIIATGSDQEICGGPDDDVLVGGTGFNLMFSGDPVLPEIDQSLPSRYSFGTVYGGNKADVLVGGQGRNFLMGDYDRDGDSLRQIAQAYNYGQLNQRFIRGADKEDGWGNLYIIDYNDVVVDSDAVRGVLGKDKKLYVYTPWSPPPGPSNSPSTPSLEDLRALANWILNGRIELPNDGDSTNNNRFELLTIDPALYGTPIDEIARHTDVYIFMEDIDRQFGAGNREQIIRELAASHFKHENPSIWRRLWEGFLTLLDKSDAKFEYKF